MSDLAKAYAAQGRANRKLIQNEKRAKTMSGILSDLASVSAYADTVQKRNISAWDEYEAGAKKVGLDPSQIEQRPSGIGMLWKTPNLKEVYSTGRVQSKQMDPGMRQRLVEQYGEEVVKKMEEKDLLLSQDTPGKSYSGKDLRFIGKAGFGDSSHIGADARHFLQETLRNIVRGGS